MAGPMGAVFPWATLLWAQLVCVRTVFRLLGWEEDPRMPSENGIWLAGMTTATRSSQQTEYHSQGGCGGRSPIPANGIPFSCHSKDRLSPHFLRAKPEGPPPSLGHERPSGRYVCSARRCAALCLPTATGRGVISAYGDGSGALRLLIATILGPDGSEIVAVEGGTNVDDNRTKRLPRRASGTIVIDVCSARARAGPHVPIKLVGVHIPESRIPISGPGLQAYPIT